MKKKLSLLLIICLVFVLGACSSGSSDTYEDEDVIEEEVVDSEDVSSDNGLDLLIWEPAEENNETFFLLRNGTYYSLGAVDPEKAAEYLPVTLSGTNTYGGCTTYSGIFVGAPEQLRDGFFSLGEVPVPVYEEGDKILVSSSKAIPNMQLRKVSFYGYAVRMALSGDHYSVYDDATNGDHSGLTTSNTEVKDSSGNVVEDIYNLEEGETYTVTWSEGTKMHEITLPADSKCYVPERSRLDDPEYDIEGNLSDDGFAEYDLSGVAPGTYKIVNTNDMVSQGLITIE